MESAGDAMSVTINAQTIITAAALLAAIGAILTLYNRGYKWVERQAEQDEEIKAIREEQKILTVGVLACLKGLKEQGCDGPVTEAIATLETHLNEEAHR